MSDFEDRIRRTLDESLSSVAAEPGRAAETMRLARRGRALRAAAAGMATVLVVAAAAIAFERRDDDDRPRPAAQPQVNTFRLDFGDTGDGTLTIDVPKGQACIHLSRNLALVARELRYAQDAQVVVVSSLPVTSGPACRPIDPGDAERVLAEPAQHHVLLGLEGTQNISSLLPFETAPPLLPDDAVIVCSQSGAVGMTPKVQPQEDGVHLRFYDDGDRWTSFNLVADDGANEGGELRGGKEFNTSFRPGPLYAGCFEHLNDAPASPRDPVYTMLTIVDPRGLWSDYEPDCDIPYLARTVETEVTPGDAALDYDAMTREYVSGVAPGDVLERPFYPQSEHIFETRMVVRDGRQVGSVMFAPFRGIGFSVEVRACPGSGLAQEARL